MGRPSIFSAKIADLICERMAEGESLRRICSSDDMPNKATVFRWLASNKEFSDQYARARESQADTLADEILDIADEGLNDTYLDEEGNERTNQDVIARSKLRVDARKWIASKLKPKAYGEKTQTEVKQEVNVNHSGSIEHRTVQEIDRRIVELLADGTSTDNTPSMPY